MSVHYKFKSTLDYDTVSFDGLHISVADLKKAIFHQKRIGKNTDFDLQITNAQTKEDYTDDKALIAKNTSLIVARVPLSIHKKHNWDRTEAPTFNANKDESSVAKSVDLTRLDGSEEDKIRAMMTQSTQDYDPSNYMKIRGSSQTGEVPANYRCYKCHQPGHWIKNCPLSTNIEPIEIKKSTGIPRSFMVPVEGPSVPGAMMTPGGTYAVPAIDHQAYKEGKKEKPPFSQGPEPVVEKPEIPEDLLCNICKDLLTDAVMIPCCGNSFCDECIRTFLLESEDHECPDCNEKDVSPESLIPNRYLRNAVLNFKNETGYAKRPVFKPPAMLSMKPTLLSEPSISEKLNAASSMSAATPTSTPSVVRPEVEAKEADKPTGKVSPSYEIATIDSAVEGDVATNSLTKLTGEEEAEVPPPPGTEPPLLPKHTSDQSWHEHESSVDNRDEDYGRYSRERRTSFSRENHRERNVPYHNRMENNNMRSGNKRQSLSPRNSQQSEYAMHPGSKSYQGHMAGENRYHSQQMHYDSNLRRSTEDRAGTPTIDEPHLHPPSHQPSMMPYSTADDRGVLQAPPYNPPPQPGLPPPSSIMPDPYMQGPRMPMYPHQQPPPPPPVAHGYPPHPVPSIPPPRYDSRPPYQPGYRPTGIPRGYNGPPRPMRVIHGMGYRGMPPLPPGMGRNLLNGAPGGVIDDPLEVFQRMLREKDERDRRLGKTHRRRTRSRSRSSRSYSRSRSRSFGRRGSSSRASRSRSPPPKRRATRSPPPSSHRARSRTPKKSRRSRSGSFSISRSRSYSRSQSPRGSIPRDRDRDRRAKKRDVPLYRSPARSPPRYHKERDRDRDRERRRSREPYGSYYNDTAAPAPHDYGVTYREPRVDRAPRYPAPSRGPLPTSATLLPPPPGIIVPPTGPPVGIQPSVPVVLPPGQQPPPLDRKDYYDSYNRYPGPPVQPQQPIAARYKKFDDVAPPGTEGYYDVPPPGVDHVERPTLIKDSGSTKNKENDRYNKEDRNDRHRDDGKTSSRSGRRDRDYDYDDKNHHHHHHHHRHDRHERKSSIDRNTKHGKKRSTSPYVNSSKYRDTKDSSPTDRQRSSSKKEKEHHDDNGKSDDRKKEKKIKEKKKKKDSDEKEKKKKKKKEKKQALIQKEAAAAAAAAAAASTAVVSSSTVNETVIKVKEEPQSGDETNNKKKQQQPLPTTLTSSEVVVPAVVIPADKVVVKSEPVDETANTIAPAGDNNLTKDDVQTPPETKIGENSPKRPTDDEKKNEPDSQAVEADKKNISLDDSLYGGLIDDAEITTTTNSIITLDVTLKSDEINNEAAPATTTTKIASTNEEDDKKEILINEKTSTTIIITANGSPKKDEFLAPVPELSKWEMDDNTDKLEEEIANTPEKETTEDEDNKGVKIVTTEVLKRAENAIFQKAINAIRPIEIKKISESRKILYQDPEPIQIFESDIESSRKSVNVTINVDKNQRNVELTSEPLKKTTTINAAKIERTKIKGSGGVQLSPTRLSAKERLGEKVEDESKITSNIVKCVVEQRRIDGLTKKGELTTKSGKRLKNRRISMSIDNSPIIPNPERKVFVGDRNKRDRLRIESRVAEEPIRIHDRSDAKRKAKSGTRTPPQPPISNKQQRNAKEKDKDRDDTVDTKRDKKSSKEETKKRKKELRSRSKSRVDDRKQRRKEKKHKRGRSSERKNQKSKDNKDTTSGVGGTKEKSLVSNNEEKDKEIVVTVGNSSEIVTSEQKTETKKQRKNPRLASEKKKSLDETGFEPDYSANTDSESDDEDDVSTRVATKRAKLDNDGIIDVDAEKTPKKKTKPASSSEDEDSSSSESSSSESDSSIESHRKKKRKHKKRKKRKSRRNDSSSDSDAYTDSSDSSSDDEKHRKKKKSKSKSKKSKAKKKSKHK